MPLDVDDRPGPAPASPDAPSRRRFLERVVAGAGACVGAGLLVAPTAAVLTPLLREGEPAAAARWLRVGLLASFPADGSPTRVVLRSDAHDAWMTVKNAPLGSVIVQRTSETELRVLSAVCPHLGCTIRYESDGDHFLCPCHGAAFARDGARRTDAGASPNPSPRGLDPLLWRVTGDVLEIRWVRYRTGTKEQEVVG